MTARPPIEGEEGYREHQLEGLVEALGAEVNKWKSLFIQYAGHQNKCALEIRKEGPLGRRVSCTCGYAQLRKDALSS